MSEHIERLDSSYIHGIGEMKLENKVAKILEDNTLSAEAAKFIQETIDQERRSDFLELRILSPEAVLIWSQSLIRRLNDHTGDYYDDPYDSFYGFYKGRQKHFHFWTSSFYNHRLIGGLTDVQLVENTNGNAAEITISYNRRFGPRKFALKFDEDSE